MKHSLQLPQKLIDDYTNSNYKLDELDLVIKVGYKNELFNQYLLVNGYVEYIVLTAWNPLGKDTALVENERQNNALSVYNMSLEVGQRLAVFYRQNAILYGKTNDLTQLIITRHLF